jgi:hypothetical protein
MRLSRENPCSRLRPIRSRPTTRNATATYAEVHIHVRHSYCAISPSRHPRIHARIHAPAAGAQGVSKKNACPCLQAAFRGRAQARQSRRSGSHQALRSAIAAVHTKTTLDSHGVPVSATPCPPIKAGMPGTLQCTRDPLSLHAACTVRSPLLTSSCRQGRPPPQARPRRPRPSCSRSRLSWALASSSGTSRAPRTGRRTRQGTAPTKGRWC